MGNCTHPFDTKRTFCLAEIFIGAAGDRETADMLANKLKSDEAKQRDAAVEPINNP